MPRVKAPKTTGSTSEEAEGHGNDGKTVEESKEQRLQRIRKQWQEELASRLRNKDASEGSQPPGPSQNYTGPEVSSGNDRETQDLNDEEAGPFYSLALPFPKEHRETAKVLALIHHYQARYEMTLPEFGEDIPEDVNLTDIAEALEHNHECANDLLIMKLIDWLGTGDYGSVLLMAEAFKGYELGLPDLDGERNRGKFCAMVACNDLQGTGVRGHRLINPLSGKGPTSSAQSSI
jgi:hypothetical protein